MKVYKVFFTHGNEENFVIIYELDLWSLDLHIDVTLKDCLFGAMKLNQNIDSGKYSCSGYDIGFDSQLLFLVSNFGFGKTDISFCVDISSSTHTDNREIDILVLVEGPTQYLDDVTKIVEFKYSINFTSSEKKLFKSALQWKKQFFIC